MMYNNIDFDTYFKNYPDAKGYFGKYGGSYIPPELQVAMNEISEAYQTICKSRQFICELRRVQRISGQTYTDFIARLSDKIERSSALCKTRGFEPYGHKLNHCMGEVLLAKYVGRKSYCRNGSWSAWCCTCNCAAFRIECDIYMGAVDIKKQAPNVARMKILGAELLK